METEFIKPEHSKRYLERRQNIGLTKPISEHIEHFKQRLLERFNITFSTDDYYNLLNRISKGKPLYKINGGNTLIQVEIEGKIVWVLYGPKNDLQPSRLKTVLIPWVAFLTPDNLSHIYSHKTFTVVVNEIIEEFIKLSHTVDFNNPNDKKRFFSQNEVPKTMQTGAYFYNKFMGNKESLIRIAVAHLCFINNLDNNQD